MNIMKYTAGVERKLEDAFCIQKDSVEIIDVVARSQVHSASGLLRRWEDILRNINNGFKSPAIFV